MMLCVLVSLTWSGCIKKPPAGDVIAPLPIVSPEVEVQTPVPSASPLPADTPVPTQTPAPTSEPLSFRLERDVQGMSVQERIGQLVMFGFSGTNAVSKEFASLMEEYAVGNVILYGDNIRRTDSDGGFGRCAKLTASINEHASSGIPLLISTDVEGGSVTRFQWGRTTLAARTLGNREDTQQAQEQFAYIGEHLKERGINTDLAPVMDVARNPSATFLGKRIISSNAETVAAIGTACIEGLHEGGCLSVIKHFPGHGATNADSHESTPKVKKTLEELWEYELLPFQAAVDAGVDGVMVGHIYYPNIDGEHIASQSSLFITELLRGQMGFTGVVMSDDFRMKGLRNQVSHREAAVQFILAGGDIILCGANHSYQREILSGLAEAVENGVLTEERINESVLRILAAKMQVTDWEP